MEARARGALCPIVVIAVATLNFAAGASAATVNAGTPPCSQSYDPYSYTETAVDSCGVKTFPLTTTQSLSDGGTESSYEMANGVTVEMKTPPPGFTAGSATSAELTEYGVPPRPTDPAQVASWEKLTAAPAPPFLVEASVSAGPDLDSRHWAGYEAIAAPGTYTSSTASWYEPTYGSSVCSSPDAVVWTGVGEEKAPQPIIGQTGTAYGLGSQGITDHEAWEEQYPDQNGPVGIGVMTKPGDFIGAWAAYAPKLEGWIGYVWDVTQNLFREWATSNDGAPVSSYYTGDAAEAIVERPGPAADGGPTNLANFETLTFNDAGGNSTYFDQIGGLNDVEMWSNSSEGFPYIGPANPPIGPTGSAIPADNGEPMAVASNPIGYDGGFQVTQQHCH